MTVPINFRLEAVEEIDATFQWYEEQRRGLEKSSSPPCSVNSTAFVTIPKDGQFFIAGFVPAPCGDFRTSFTIVSYQTRSMLLPFNTGTGIPTPGGDGNS